MILTQSDIIRIEQKSITELRPQEQSNLPVTWLKHDNGDIYVLSRFGDTVWEYPKSRFSAGTANSTRKFDFKTVPRPFRITMKTALWNFNIIKQRPAGGTLYGFFKNSRLFFRYLYGIKVTDLSKVNQMHCANYCDHVSKLVNKKTGIILSSSIRSQKLMAVESLHLVTAKTAFSFASPWPDSSASYLAGLTGQGVLKAKTLVIPDDIWQTLFQPASERLNQAGDLFELKEQVESIRAEWRSKKWGSNCISRKVKPLLKEAGYNGLKDFNSAYLEIQESAIIVILSLSGVRVHELCYLKPLAGLGNRCWYATEDDDGEKTYWMASRSDKTGEGETEWMIPELARKALDVAQRYAIPLQALMKEEQEERLRSDPHCPKAQALMQEYGKIFLGKPQFSENKVEGLSSSAITRRINRFAKVHGVDWHFTPHQFRRTFACHVARSEYGDLRYLRDHYKHWSLDMTGLYYQNDKQDAELYDEIMTSVINGKIEIVAHWLDPDTMLTGGNAEQIRSFRDSNEKLRTYKNRREMAESISELVAIRATGGGWCTADTGGCGGRGIIESTRCGDCEGSVIDDKNIAYWQGIYKQQLELKEIQDIGVAIQVRIDRDIGRCEKALTDLGVLGVSENDCGEQEGSA